jgi:hypothetical protein
VARVDPAAREYRLLGGLLAGSGGVPALRRFPCRRLHSPKHHAGGSARRLFCRTAVLPWIDAEFGISDQTARNPKPATVAQLLRWESRCARMNILTSIKLQGNLLAGNLGIVRGGSNAVLDSRNFACPHIIGGPSSAGWRNNRPSSTASWPPAHRRAVERDKAPNYRTPIASGSTG